MTTRRRLLAGPGLLLVLLTLVAGCTIPLRPLWWPHAKRVASVPAVAHPWHQGMRQLGIQVYWTANRTDSSDAIIRAKAQRIIDYAISLHANSVAVTFPFYTRGFTSDAVYSRPKVTPSPGHIAIFLAAAARARMRVTLRPVLDEDALVTQNPHAWRGSIEPRDRAAWFRSYRKLLLPYLAAARAGHAATFVLGTELNSLEGAPQWPGLVRSLRSGYDGQLAYDENYDEFEAGTANPPVRSHDVDAYPRFSVPGNASVARLTRSWDAWLGAHPLSARRELTLSELGIAATAGAYQNPWTWRGATTAPLDTRAQAAWYQAACNAVSAEQIGGGIYWWEVNFDASPADPRPFESDRLTFLDRPAQQVIKNCFAKLST
jgi:Glycoside Hydrolase Family 113